MPLRYKISSWRQLSKCKSNNDPDLRIRVTDFCNNMCLRGFRICLEHPKFGPLFACVLYARGAMITPSNTYTCSELSPDQILLELAKYGFLITYVPESNLGSEQLEYLMTVNDLGFDKLRLLCTWSVVNGTKVFSDVKIVVFKVDPLGDWLNNAYMPSEDEFQQAMSDGVALNITGISNTKHFNWDWLKDVVCSIDDVIADNTDDMCHHKMPAEPDPTYLSSDQSEED